MTVTPEPIVWRVHLSSPPLRVRDAWLSPDDHARFLCEVSRRTKTGFHLQFIDGSVTDCTICDVSEALIRLQYFGAEVTLELEPAGGGTDVTLTTWNVPADEWLDVYAGWLNVLLPLKAWLDFGVDLRNHDAARTWRQRFVDQ